MGDRVVKNVQTGVSARVVEVALGPADPPADDRSDLAARDDGDVVTVGELRRLGLFPSRAATKGM